MGKSVKIFEDNGGGVHAVVFADGKVQNVICHLEQEPNIQPHDFLEAARDSFPLSNDYNQDDASGVSIEEAAKEIEAFDDLIAEFHGDNADFYPDKMGRSGINLFGIRADNCPYTDLCCGTHSQCNKVCACVMGR